MTHKILILDDDADFNKLLTNIFSKAKELYEIVSCQDPEEALKLIYSSKFDLLVTDYRMPKITGFELAQKVLQDYPNMPIIMVSAFLNAQTIRELINMGVRGIFLKPLNVFSLLERTKEILNEKNKKIEQYTESNIEINNKKKLDIYPCIANKSEIFTQQLIEEKEKKRNLLLLGHPGAPFKLIYEEFKQIAENETEPFVELTWNELNINSAKEKLNILKNPEEKGLLTIKFPTITAATKNKDTQELYDLLKNQDQWLNNKKWSLRGFFTSEVDLNSLLEEEIINDELYLSIGTRELIIPKLNDIKEDINELCKSLIKKYSKSNIKIMDANAVDYLKQYNWNKDYDELVSAIKKIIKNTKETVITKEIIETALSNNNKNDPQDFLHKYLEEKANDYCEFVYILNNYDKEITLNQLKINEKSLMNFVKSLT